MASFKRGLRSILMGRYGWITTVVLASLLIARGIAGQDRLALQAPIVAAAGDQQATGRGQDGTTGWSQALHGERFPVSTEADQLQDQAASADGTGPHAGNALPGSVDELRRLQQRVRQVVGQVMPATVGLQIGSAQGSGVIVSAEGLVLTAGHVSGQPGRRATIILPDGQRLRGQTLGRNQGIDSGMIQITSDPPDEAGFAHVDLGRSAEVRPGDWSIALGHPGGYERGREPVVRLGRVVRSARRVIWTDCTLVGGDSGGPLFNLDGQVIGIHSRISVSTSGNFHVPIDTYHDTWERLVEGEAWGLGSGQPRAFLGVTGEDHERGCRLTTVLPNTPAAEAGLRVGDIITRWDGQRISSIDALIEAIRESEPGDRIELRYLRDGQRGRLTVELGQFGG